MSKEVVVQIRTRPDLKTKWEAVAASVGLSLSAWVRVTLNSSCGVSTVLTAADTTADTTIKVSSGTKRKPKGPVLHVGPENPASEVLNRALQKIATSPEFGGPRKTPPAGLSNSDLQSWLRKNQ